MGGVGGRRAVHGRGIGEDRSDDGRAGRDVPGELAGIEIILRVRRELVIARHGDIAVLVDGVVETGNLRRLVHPVVGREEPQLVSNDPAADVGAEVGPVVTVDAHSLKNVVLGDDLGGAHSEGVVVDETVSVKLVAARLGDDVDHAAERPTVLGRVAAGLDLDFLDELAVDRLPLEAPDDVGRVDTVDDELVLHGGGPVDGQRQGPSLSIALVLIDARVRPDDLRVISAERKFFHDLGRVAGSARRRGRVHERHLAADHHGLLGGELDLQVHGRRGVEGDGRVLFDGAHTSESGRDLVDPRREAREAVSPIAGGHGGARPLQVGTRHLHRDAGERSSIGVADRAHDRPRRLGERRASRHREGGNHPQHRQEIPSKSRHRTPPLFSSDIKRARRGSASAKRARGRAVESGRRETRRPARGRSVEQKPGLRGAA